MQIDGETPLNFFHKRMWHNGGKLTLLILAAGVVAVTITIININDFLEGPYAPLYGFNSPQPVAERVVPAGGEVVATVTKCAHGDTAVSGSRFWRRLEPTQKVVGTTEGGGIIEDGCDTRTIANPLPPEAVAGEVWRYEGINCAFEGSAVQCVAWQTEPVTVG